MKGASKKLSFEQKEYKRYELDKERDAMERPILNCTGYDLIFPL